MNNDMTPDELTPEDMASIERLAKRKQREDEVFEAFSREYADYKTKAANVKGGTISVDEFLVSKYVGLEAELAEANATIARMLAAIADVPEEEPQLRGEVAYIGILLGRWQSAERVRKAAKQGVDA